MTNYLPPNPSLKQLKTQAKDLLSAHRAGDADACIRIKAHLPRLAQAAEDDVRNARIALREAQLVLAREYGFPSWPRLQRHLDSGVARAYRTEHERRLYRPFQGTDISAMEGHTRERLDAHRAGLVSAFGFAANLKKYVPRLEDMSEEQILAADITQDDVHAVLAHQRGFRSWQDLLEYDSGKAHQEIPVDAEFQAAIDAVEARDSKSSKRGRSAPAQEKRDRSSVEITGVRRRATRTSAGAPWSLYLNILSTQLFIYSEGVELSSHVLEELVGLWTGKSKNAAASPITAKRATTFFPTSSSKNSTTAI